MNLVIDVGNTDIKFAVFKNHNMVKRRTGKFETFEKDISILLKEFESLNKAIVSSVGRFNKKDINFVLKHLDVFILDKNTKIPFKNSYKTPETLGVDRIALVAASVKNYNHKNVLIIDAGTCITYDFITKENLYIGGAISPGIRIRYQSLNNLTTNLPLLEKNTPINLIGNSTKESIHSGVINGVLFEMGRYY